MPETSTSKALVCRKTDGQNRLSLEEVPLPSLKPQQVLVRTLAVAQNPTDVKSFDLDRYGEGAVLGGDFCGRVEQIGSDVTRVKPGDRVGGLLRLGAYATHIVAEERFCFKVPEAVSSEAAATLPLALDTAWLALFSPYSLGLDRIIKGDKTQLLIWGASTSVGQYAIQILKHFGFEFAVTCSKPELVKDLGAKHVFDYRSPTVVEDIKKTLPNITHVFDCVATETSSKQASGAVCEACGLLCTVAPGKRNTEHIESRVKATDVIVWTAFFTELNYGPVHLPPRAEDRDLSDELFENLTEMLTGGIIKPNPVRIVDGGLDGVTNGFQLYRNGAVSGQKLVYKLD